MPGSASHKTTILQRSAQHEAFLSAVPQVVGREPMTCEQLASALEKRTGIAHVRDLILSSSWGNPLETVGYPWRPLFQTKTGAERHVCQSPSVDGRMAFDRARAGSPGNIRRYLRAYGPATTADIARWRWDGEGKTRQNNSFRQ
ncbi:MAG TPA: crosslink repair DNA glycosylase YcaQ family protein [Ktedonobacteraceae bacterium]|nr:crosslink repair DNA glycosylase YcaQ family protein [Ktedonobacteraceae bacterium]